LFNTVGVVPVLYLANSGSAAMSKAAVVHLC